MVVHGIEAGLRLPGSHRASGPAQPARLAGGGLTADVSKGEAVAGGGVRGRKPVSTVICHLGVGGFDLRRQGGRRRLLSQQDGRKSMS